MGSKGSSTTKQSFSLPPEFRQAYKKSIDMATAATNQPYQAYQGQLVAGLNPTQLQGMSNVNAAQGMALPAIGRGMQLTERAAQGITPELYNQFYSPYVRDVADTTFANMMESNAQQRSGLKSGAIQAGAFGGDRGGIAQAEMARQQNLGLGQTMSGIYNQGYGQAMQLAGQQAQNYGAMGQQLAGLGVGAQGSVLQGAQAQLAAGVQQQATDQAQLQAAYEQWMQRQAYPYQQAQFFANIAQGLGAGAGGTSSTTTPGPSWGSQALGAIGAVGSIFSDERMKENIEAVGTLNDGQTIYRYNFKGDPKTQIGLLAQEVETRNPEAVTEAGGLKMVDYRDATDSAASMGGLVTPEMQRAAFAGGGVPYYPYESMGYVPEGKIRRGGRGIPDAPAPFKDEGLAEDWKTMKPLTEEQVGGLKALAGKLGLTLNDPEYAALGKLIAQSPDDAYAAKFEDEYPSYSGFSSGGVAGRNGYLLGGEPTMEDAMAEAGVAAAEPPASGEFRYPTNEEVEGYIAQSAAKRGIDPEVAIRVWRSEGASGDPREGWQSKIVRKDGSREPSYGPYQLYMEGGLGNEMQEATGLSPSDPRNWQPSVDFALDKAAEGGWGPWAGAKAIGLDPRAGLGGAKASGEYSPAGVGQIVPMADEAPAEEPRSRFSLDKLIASEDNPSIIESIMGRRLSPEARAAVMNASFAMLAGRSPFMGVNIGEAGKVGMQTYYNALAQKAGMAEKMSEIEKRGVETEAARQNIRQSVLSLYNQARQNFMIENGSGAQFMPFSDWAKMYGFPDFVGEGADVFNMQPSTQDTEVSGDVGGEGVDRRYVPPIIGAEEASTAKEASKSYEANPIDSPTILANPEGGPSDKKKGTIPYYQEKANAFESAALSSPFNDASKKINLDAAAAYREEARKLQESDAYKDYSAFTANYEKTYSDLQKLAEINSRFKGGRGSEQWASFIGALQNAGLDWAVPENWQSVPGDYDQIMKGAAEMAVRNASTLGKLANAPGSLMEMETKFTPDANLSPSARYSIISRALADLMYKNDVYATWDQGPNFATHQKNFNRANDYQNYIMYAQDVLAPPALYEGEIAPGGKQQSQPEGDTQKIISAALADLNNRFANERVGTVKYLKNYKFEKTANGWVLK